MSALFLCACAITGPGTFTPASENAELVQGPPVEVIVTPFDPALQCLKGRIGKDRAHILYDLLSRGLRRYGFLHHLQLQSGQR